MTQAILDQNVEAATNAELSTAARQQVEAIELALRKMLMHYDSGAPIKFAALDADGIYDMAMRACDGFFAFIGILRCYAHEGLDVRPACEAIVNAPNPVTCARAILV